MQCRSYKQPSNADPRLLAGLCFCCNVASDQTLGEHILLLVKQNYRYGNRISNMSGVNERRRRNDDSELPGIRTGVDGTSATGDTITATTSTGTTTITTSSPLLILLDGVLSRHETRVAEAMHIILHEYKVVIIATSNATKIVTEPTDAKQEGNLQRVQRGTVDRDESQKQPSPSAGTLQPLSDESYGIESPCTSSASLCIVINALLNQYPHLARIPSDHDGSLPLHFAASLGNVPVAIAILQKYPPAATKPNQKGKIPLHYAAREGRVDMVKYFLHACPETCTIATDKGKLAIHFAAGDGHAEITAALLHAYPKSAAISSHKGKLPLHFCARWGYMDIALQLVSIYPNAVKALDWEGSLPLHDAAREGEYKMAKFLMNQYPKSLQVANLRGEIPLCPAIRSANTDLITYMIQAWPMSGKHVLRNVSADDHISSWRWSTIELLLRGATMNFHKCTLLENHEPPSFCLMDDVQPLSMEDIALTVEEKKAQKKARKAATTALAFTQRPPATALDTGKLVVQEEPYIATCTYATLPNSSLKAMNSTRRFASAPPHAASVGVAPLFHCNGVRVPPPVMTPPSLSTAVLPKVRCKSPTLELSDDPNMKAKRARKMPSSQFHPLMDHFTSQYRTFIPIHAAFECQASYQVIERVLSERSYDVHRCDEMDRNVLHFAMAHCHDPAIVDLVLSPHHYILTPPTVRVVDPTTGRLPLHIAIAHTAHVRIIQALLHHDPTSGITPCRTPDEFYDKTPIHMATHFNCDLSTVYELLRIDPSFVLKMQW